jgi:magnesium transporter
MTQNNDRQELFFSQFQGTRILDAAGQLIGKVRDMAVRWSSVLPEATCIKYSKGEHAHIAMAQIAQLTKDSIILKSKMADLPPQQLRADEIYVSKWLMDKQIIDRTGAKLVRVNDIQLLWDDQQIVMVAVDIGIRGLFRRLGLEFIVASWPNSFMEWQFITPLENKMANLKLSREYAQLRQLHPADMADIIEDMDYHERNEFLSNLDNEEAADALVETDLRTQVEIISGLDEERASDILEEMSADEAADILGALSEDKSDHLLRKMAVEDAEDVLKLMSYDEDVAGSWMTTEFITFPADMTAGETIERLRALASEAETIYYLYIADADEMLLGVCSLRELLLADVGAKLGDFMHTRLRYVRDYDERDKVVEVIMKYNFLAVPVLDKVGVILGIITVDDVLRSVLKDRSNLNTFSNFMLSSRKEEAE